MFNFVHIFFHGCNYYYTYLLILATFLLPTSPYDFINMTKNQINVKTYNYPKIMCSSYHVVMEVYFILYIFDSIIQHLTTCYFSPYFWIIHSSISSFILPSPPLFLKNINYIFDMLFPGVNGNIMESLFIKIYIIYFVIIYWNWNFIFC